MSETSSDTAPEASREPVAETPKQPEVFSIKTLSGDLFAGILIEINDKYGPKCFVLEVDGLLRVVPVAHCEWWAIGTESVQEVKARIFQEMKENAKKVLLEQREEALRKKREQQGQQEDDEEQLEEEVESPEAQQLQQKAYTDRTGFRGHLRSIAGHQRTLGEKRSQQIVQPGEEPRKKEGSKNLGPSRTTMSRLSDGAAEL